MLRIFLFILVLSPCVSAQEEWDIHRLDDAIFVRVHGEITWGDTLIFRIPKDKCDIMEHLFTFYTAYNHEDIKYLETIILPINNNDIDLGAEVLFVKPFLAGHSVWFTLGHYKIKEHLSFLQTLDPFFIRIVDGSNFTAKDYFDVPNNSWQLAGMKEKIEEGQLLCRDL